MSVTMASDVIAPDCTSINVRGPSNAPAASASPCAKAALLDRGEMFPGFVVHFPLLCGKASLTKIDLEIEASDFGALPVLVAREIAAVERWVNAHGPVLTGDADAMTRVYLAQLRSIERVLLAARGGVA